MRYILDTNIVIAYSKKVYLIFLCLRKHRKIYKELMKHVKLTQELC